MIRRFPSPFSLLWSGAVWLFLWAPLLFLGARSLLLAARFPALWREVVLARGVWIGTLELCVFSAFGAVILGIPLGFCLARGPKWLRFGGTIAAALPLAVPPVILAAPFVSASGKTAFPLFFSSLTLAMSFYPLVALCCALAIRAVPRAEEEAALLNSSPLRAWTGVLGRRILPAILAGAGAVGAACAWEMGAPDLLSQPSFGMSVYRALNSPQMLAPGESAARAFLAALGVPLLALLFLLPAARAMRGLGAASKDGAPSEVKLRFAGLGALILLVSPGFIVWQLFAALEGAKAAQTAIAANDDALWNTLATATVSALWLPVLALGLAAQWRFWPPKWRRFALGATLLPGMFAPVVIGVALIEFWNRAALGAVYDSSLGMVLVGHFARFFPLALALIWIPLAGLDPDLSFSAQNMGATPSRAFWGLEVPLLRGAIAGAMGVLWALCAGELSVSVLVHGPGGDTLAIPIFGLLHAGIAADVAALCLLLVLLCGGAMALALVGFSRETRT